MPPRLTLIMHSPSSSTARPDLGGNAQSTEKLHQRRVQMVPDAPGAAHASNDASFSAQALRAWTGSCSG
ncbi:hypothetical protein SFUMM280S_10678 [Streptomyces fumanus]